MADVWDFGPDDPIDCAVLVCLASHSNDDGQSCYPSVGRIARMTRYCEKSVSRSIATLEADGWLRVARGRGRGVVSQYSIVIDRLKRGQSVPLCIDKTPLPVPLLKTEKGTLTTVKGDSHGNPPAPPIRKNRQETSVKNRTPHSPQRGQPDQALDVEQWKPIPKRFRKRRARDGPADAAFVHSGPGMDEETIRELQEKARQREARAG